MTGASSVVYAARAVLDTYFRVYFLPKTFLGADSLSQLCPHYQLLRLRVPTASSSTNAFVCFAWDSRVAALTTESGRATAAKSILEALRAVRTCDDISKLAGADPLLEDLNSTEKNVLENENDESHIQKQWTTEGVRMLGFFVGDDATAIVPSVYSEIRRASIELGAQYTQHCAQSATDETNKTKTDDKQQNEEEVESTAGSHRRRSTSDDSDHSGSVDDDEEDDDDENNSPNLPPLRIPATATVYIANLPVYELLSPMDGSAYRGAENDSNDDNHNHTNTKSETQSPQSSNQNDTPLSAKHAYAASLRGTSTTSRGGRFVPRIFLPKTEDKNLTNMVDVLAQGLSSRSGPARHASFALLHRVAVVRGINVEEVLRRHRGPEWLSRLQQRVFRQTYSILAPDQRLGQLHMLAFLLKNLPNLFPVTPQVLASLAEAISETRHENVEETRTDTSSERGSMRCTVGSDAPPEQLYKLKAATSAMPYQWPEPFSVGWPTFGISDEIYHRYEHESSKGRWYTKSWSSVPPTETPLMRTRVQDIIPPLYVPRLSDVMVTSPFHTTPCLSQDTYVGFEGKNNSANRPLTVQRRVLEQSLFPSTVAYTWVRDHEDKSGHVDTSVGSPNSKSSRSQSSAAFKSPTNKLDLERAMTPLLHHLQGRFREASNITHIPGTFDSALAHDLITCASFSAATACPMDCGDYMTRCPVRPHNIGGGLCSLSSEEINHTNTPANIWDVPSEIDVLLTHRDSCLYPSYWASCIASRAFHDRVTSKVLSSGGMTNSSVNFQHSTYPQLLRIAVAEFVACVYERVIVRHERKTRRENANSQVPNSVIEYFDAKSLNASMAKLRLEIVPVLVDGLMRHSIAVLAASYEALQVVFRFYDSVQAMPKILEETKLKENLSVLVAGLKGNDSLHLRHLNAVGYMLSLHRDVFDGSIMKSIVALLKEHSESPEQEKLTPEIVAALFRLLHLLAKDEDTIKFVMTVFLRLQRAAPVFSVNSLDQQYLLPVAQILNERPSDTLRYFLEPNSIFFRNETAASFFVDLLRHPRCRALKRHLLTPKCVKRLVDFLSDTPRTESGAKSSEAHSQHTTAIVQMHALRIIRLISKTEPRILNLTGSALIDRITEMWRNTCTDARQLSSLHIENADTLQNSTDATTRASNPAYELYQQRAKKAKLLTKIMVSYVRLCPRSMRTMFGLLQAFTVPSLADFTYLEEFFQREIAYSSPLGMKRHILKYYLRIFADSGSDSVMKAIALKYLVLPMIRVTLRAESRQYRHAKRAAAAAAVAANAVHSNKSRSTRSRSTGSSLSGRTRHASVESTDTVQSDQGSIGTQQQASSQYSLRTKSAQRNDSSVVVRTTGSSNHESDITMSASMNQSLSTVLHTPRVGPEQAVMPPQSLMLLGKSAVSSDSGETEHNTNVHDKTSTIDTSKTSETKDISEGEASLAKYDNMVPEIQSPRWSLLDAELLAPTIITLFDFPQASSKSSSPSDETESFDISKAPSELRIQLLRLASLLTFYMSEELTPHKKMLLKFGWNQAKCEEVDTRVWALIFLARFFQAYVGAEADSILSVFTLALRTPFGLETEASTSLRAHDRAQFSQQNGQLVQRALALLTPVLASRFSASFSHACKYLRIILCERHRTQHITHVWHVVRQHEKLFYPYRDDLVPLLVHHLTSVAQPSSTVVTSPSLGIDLIGIYIKWEVRQRQENINKFIKNRQQNSGKEGASNGPGLRQPHGLSSRPRMRDFHTGSIIVNFCVRTALLVCQRREQRGLTRRCLRLLHVALNLWPSASVSAEQFHHLISPNSREYQKAVESAHARGQSSAGRVGPLSPQFLKKLEKKGASWRKHFNTDLRASLTQWLPYGLCEQIPVAPSDALLATVLRVLNLILDCPGDGRYFLVSCIGLTMLLLSPVFKSDSRRVWTLFRRLIRSLLKQFPIARPSLQMKYTHFYPWLLRALCLKLLQSADPRQMHELRSITQRVEETAAPQFQRARGETIVRLVSMSLVSDAEDNTRQWTPTNHVPDQPVWADIKYPNPLPNSSARLLLNQHTRRYWFHHFSVDEILGTCAHEFTMCFVHSAEGTEQYSVNLLRMLREFIWHNNSLLDPMIDPLMSWLRRVAHDHVTDKIAREDRSNKRAKREFLQRLQVTQLKLLIQMLASRALRFKPRTRHEFVKLLGLLMQRTPDPSVIWMVLEIGRKWFTISPTDDTSISHGLVQTDKTALLQAFTSLSVAPLPGQMRSNTESRAKSLGSYYLPLQHELFRLLLDIYYGQETKPHTTTPMLSDPSSGTQGDTSVLNSGNSQKLTGRTRSTSGSTGKTSIMDTCVDDTELEYLETDSVGDPRNVPNVSPSFLAVCAERSWNLQPIEYAEANALRTMMRKEPFRRSSVMSYGKIGAMDTVDNQLALSLQRNPPRGISGDYKCHFPTPPKWLKTYLSKLLAPGVFSGDGWVRRESMRIFVSTSVSKIVSELQNAEEQYEAIHSFGPKNVHKRLREHAADSILFVPNPSGHAAVTALKILFSAPLYSFAAYMWLSVAVRLLLLAFESNHIQYGCDGTLDPFALLPQNLSTESNAILRTLLATLGIHPKKSTESTSVTDNVKQDNSETFLQKQAHETTETDVNILESVEPGKHTPHEIEATICQPIGIATIVDNISKQESCTKEAETLNSNKNQTDDDIDMHDDDTTSNNSDVNTLFSKFSIWSETTEFTGSSASELLYALSELSYCSLDIARELWLSLLPIAWSACTDIQRDALLPYVSASLVKDNYQYYRTVDPVTFLDMNLGFSSRELPSSFAHVPEPIGPAKLLNVTPDTAGVSLGARGCAAAPTARAESGVYEYYMTFNNQALHGTGVQARSGWGTSAVQLFFEGISKCEPPPALRPEVLVYVAKRFRCWELAAPMLQRQLFRMLRPVQFPTTNSMLAQRILATDPTSDQYKTVEQSLSLPNGFYSSIVCGKSIESMPSDSNKNETGRRSRQNNARTRNARTHSSDDDVMATFDAMRLPPLPGSETNSGAQISSRVNALMSLYEQIQDPDMIAGLQRHFHEDPITDIITMTSAHGEWQLASDAAQFALQKAGNIETASSQLTTSQTDTTADTKVVVSTAGTSLSSVMSHTTSSENSISTSTTSISTNHTQDTSDITMKSTSGHENQTAAHGSSLESILAHKMPDRQRRASDVMGGVAFSGLKRNTKHKKRRRITNELMISKSTLTSSSLSDDLSQIMDKSSASNEPSDTAKRPIRRSRRTQSSTIATRHPKQTSKEATSMETESSQKVQRKATKLKKRTSKGGASTSTKHTDSKPRKLTGRKRAHWETTHTESTVLTPKLQSQTIATEEAWASLNVKYSPQIVLDMYSPVFPKNSTFVSSLSSKATNIAQTNTSMDVNLTKDDNPTKNEMIKGSNSSGLVTVSATSRDNLSPGSKGNALQRTDASSTGLNDHTLGLSKDNQRPSEVEHRYWESVWIESARQLCYWPVLQSYGESTNDPVLWSESLSRLGNFGDLEKLLQTSAVHIEALARPEIRLLEAEHALQSTALHNMSRLIDDAAEMLRRQWWALPGNEFGGHAHQDLLALTQRVMEMQESYAIANNDTELTKKIALWRGRLPNIWEGVAAWDSVLTWRYNLFDYVINNMNADGEAVNGNRPLHDAAWTVIRLAKTGRKLQLPEVCLRSLARLHQMSNMLYMDSFVKAREHILVGLQSCVSNPSQALYECGVAPQTESTKQTEELGGVLTTLLATSLRRFQASEQSEMLRLHGLLCAHMGAEMWTEAHKAFSAALRIRPDNATAWLTWGNFLSRVFTLVQPPASSIVSALRDAEKSKELSAATGTGELSSTSTMNTKTDAMLPSKMLTERTPILRQLVSSHLSRQLPGVVDAANSIMMTAGINVPLSSGRPSSDTPTNTHDTNQKDVTKTSVPTSTNGADTSQNDGLKLTIRGRVMNTNSAVADPLVIAQQAIVAYLMAVVHDCANRAMQLSRVLWLLQYDDDSGTLCNTLRQHGTSVSTWQWVPWIPQLLQMFSTTSLDAATDILSSISQRFPNAVFYALREYKNARSRVLQADRLLIITTTPGILESKDGTRYHIPPYSSSLAVREFSNKMQAKFIQTPKHAYIERHASLPTPRTEFPPLPSHTQTASDTNNSTAQTTTVVNMSNTAATSTEMTATTSTTPKGTSTDTEKTNVDNHVSDGGLRSQSVDTLSVKSEANTEEPPTMGSSNVNELDEAGFRDVAATKIFRATVDSSRYANKLYTRLRSCQPVSTNEMWSMAQALSQCMPMMWDDMYAIIDTCISRCWLVTNAFESGIPERIKAHLQFIYSSYLDVNSESTSSSSGRKVLQLKHAFRKSFAQDFLEFVPVRDVSNDMDDAKGNSDTNKESSEDTISEPKSKRTRIQRSTNSSKTNISTATDSSTTTDVSTTVASSTTTDAATSTTTSTTTTLSDLNPPNNSTEKDQSTISSDTKPASTRSVTRQSSHKESIRMRLSSLLSSVPNPHVAKTITQVVARLKKWRSVLRLQCRWHARETDKTNYMYYLSRRQYASVEIPGQYTDDSVLGISPSPRVLLHHIAGTIETAQNRYSHLMERRVTLMGNDGRPYRFAVQTVSNQVTSTDVLIKQMHILFNRLLAGHNDSRKRLLSLQGASVIPLNDRHRLISHDMSGVSFGSIFSQYCAERGVDDDTVVMAFRQFAQEEERNLFARQNITPQTEKEKSTMEGSPFSLGTPSGMNEFSTMETELATKNEIVASSATQITSTGAGSTTTTGDGDTSGGTTTGGDGGTSTSTKTPPTTTPQQQLSMTNTANTKNADVKKTESSSRNAVSGGQTVSNTTELSESPVETPSESLDGLRQEIRRHATLHGFRRVCDTVVPPSILLHTIRQWFTCPDDFAVFRSRFTRQYAASSLLSYLLCLNDKSAHRIKICLSSGDVLNLELKPTFSPHRGVLTTPDAVPFRMTRNIVSLMTPFGAKGSFVNSFTASAGALHAHSEWLSSYLSLFFRDELIRWRLRGEQLHDLRVRVATDEILPSLDTNVSLFLHRVARLQPQGMKERLEQLKQEYEMKNQTNTKETVMNTDKTESTTTDISSTSTSTGTAASGANASSSNSTASSNTGNTTAATAIATGTGQEEKVASTEAVSNTNSAGQSSSSAVATSTSNSVPSSSTTMTESNETTKGTTQQVSESVVYDRATRLLEEACEEKNQCQMPWVWHPWF